MAQTKTATYQSKSGDVVTSILKGDFKGAAKSLLQAWGLAVKDPEWVAGAVIATATPFMGPEGAAARSAGEAGTAEATTVAKAAPKPSPKFQSPTNPAQAPPTSVPDGWRVRVMPATEQYPNGYWKMEKPMSNGSWQPIDPSTMKPGGRPQTHVPLPGIEE